MFEPSWVSVTHGKPELAIPLVCDSPHSGTVYPDDFQHAIARQALRSGEDTHIETLWGHVPAVGGALVAAHFPRTYIDPNRPLDAIDPELLAEPWPGPMEATEQTRLGMGLVWRQVGAGQPIYARPLTAAQVRQRIERCWKPYHQALHDTAERALQDFGCLWHLNLHSMPHNAYERLGIRSPRPLADFVLGDLHGASCDAEFVGVVKRVIELHGYRVAVNDPYAGLELVRLMGAPASGRQSLQVEINRSLYMDERTRERNARFDGIRADLASITEEIARHIRRHPRLDNARATALRR